METRDGRGGEAALKQFCLVANAASRLQKLDCGGWRLINSLHCEPPVGVPTLHALPALQHDRPIPLLTPQNRKPDRVACVAAGPLRFVQESFRWADSVTDWVS